MAFGLTHSILTPLSSVKVYLLRWTIVSVPFHPLISFTLTYQQVLHYYVPFHKIRPDIFTPDGGMRIVRSYFRYSLQHPLMFETIVTLSRARLALSSFPSGGLDHLTMYHYGQSLEKLRKLVDDGETDLEDATLFAMLALICVEV